jgi:hypothetical protein
MERILLKDDIIIFAFRFRSFMKYIILILFLLPFAAFSQTTCKSAYIHGNQVLDSMHMPADIAAAIDSMKMANVLVMKETKTELKAKYKDAKIFKKKYKAAQKEADEKIAAAKYKMLNKIYGAKIREASLKIYDKGKKYETVFNADNQYFSNIPENACDVTQQCIKLVRESGNK